MVPVMIYYDSIVEEEEEKHNGKDEESKQNSFCPHCMTFWQGTIYEVEISGFIKD